MRLSRFKKWKKSLSRSYMYCELARGGPGAGYSRACDYIASSVRASMGAVAAVHGPGTDSHAHARRENPDSPPSPSPSPNPFVSKGLRYPCQVFRLLLVGASRLRCLRASPALSSCVRLRCLRAPPTKSAGSGELFVGWPLWSAVSLSL